MSLNIELILLLGGLYILILALCYAADHVTKKENRYVEYRGHDYGDD